MKLTGLSLIPALALVAACSQQEEEAPQDVELTLHEVMKNEIDVRADEVWAIGNAALDDQAGIDPDLMSDEDWTNLAAHSLSLRQAAIDLATLDPIIVTRPGVKIVDEGVPFGDSSADVQANIDKNPQGMRDMANALAAHMADLAAAAKDHDAARAGPLINQLDGVCETCHLEYWYPSQKEIIEQYINEGVLDPAS
ncbi:hypothetical protein FHS61_001302 [Altererythrobacter atlanticus]|uniref:Cytochrome C n=1 Tax=Croceibacterium atlanticum TaxID=1267766 RepID=A0A0F7KXP6_9SPHN|nr:cytochrome c [Croceibacterium atlanticum]AKH43987.1 Cytochrome C' [Croceibacterium atlanticum]MBB5732293.1 hypothetical protein [Croceibacterium atlanticum]